MLPAQQELFGGDVIRLGGETTDRFHSDGTIKALPDDFFCSSEDNRADLLSVWDCSKTTIVQARGFMGKLTAPAFRLAVTDIRSVPVPKTDLTLRVLRDPDPSLGGPGANGHCGINRLCSATKRARDNIRAQLIGIAYHIPE